MSNEEQKEEKPKKMFVVVHTTWDDGEVDTEMYEFRKNPSGRGAPGKWRLGSKDFVRRVEELLGDADQIGEVMASNVGLSTSNTVCSVSVNKKVPIIPDDEAKLIDSPIVDVEKDAPNDLNDIEFGEFDKDK